MTTLLIAFGALIGYIIAYHTYGRWLARRIFRLDPNAEVPSEEFRDDVDFVPTDRGVVFGHHFTSIAGTGPIVGPALAVMWGWLPALIWVLLGSVFIGAVHDFGALVVSLRNRGQTVGDIAARVLNRRVRILFLFILFMTLTVVLAVFGLVIASVFRMYPASILPCMVQIPIAVMIGIRLHHKGVGLFAPSFIALMLMYLTVYWGDWGFLHSVNESLANMPVITWVVILLIYSYIASVLPVWILLQPRDYINSLQLLTALGLILSGLTVAAWIGGAPPIPGAARPPLEIIAPRFRPIVPGAPPIWPFLFITIACGACSGFHCLVSSGTSSKQLKAEPDAQFVGYGSMLTEGFLAVLVILACVASLGLGTYVTQLPLTVVADSVGLERALADRVATEHVPLMAPPHPDDRLAIAYGAEGEAHAVLFAGEEVRIADGSSIELAKDGKSFEITTAALAALRSGRLLEKASRDATSGLLIDRDGGLIAMDQMAFATRYHSWQAAGGLSAKIGAFVAGAANFLKALGVSAGTAVALMGVLVASFAGTTLDTACRLQRYVIQELATACRMKTSRSAGPAAAVANASIGEAAKRMGHSGPQWSILGWLQNRHGATILGVLLAGMIAALPKPGVRWSWESAGSGGMILWPLFGASNQLLAGLAFLVVAFFLWRRRISLWFIMVPMLFMLVMPAWAMIQQLPAWIHPATGDPNWGLICVAIATLLLEGWMVVEAILLWPKVRGVVEEDFSNVDHSSVSE